MKLKSTDNQLSSKISPEQIRSFRAQVEECMRKLGATETDLSFLHDEAICNTIRRNGKPEDLAWALLQ